MLFGNEWWIIPLFYISRDFLHEICEFQRSLQICFPVVMTGASDCLFKTTMLRTTCENKRVEQQCCAPRREADRPLIILQEKIKRYYSQICQEVPVDSFVNNCSPLSNSQHRSSIYRIYRIYRIQRKNHTLEPILTLCFF